MGEAIKKNRDSGLELFRIITMLIIVAHHYVVNSGVSDEIINSAEFSLKSIFMLIFGWGGKTGINCFVLITGYFMCKSEITLKKFLKLVLWVEFYKVLFYLIFLITGYQEFSFSLMIERILPVRSAAQGFTSAYLLFYLFIPFLNILIRGMDKKKHLLLVCLCLFIYTGMYTIKLDVRYNYVTWFSIIYLIGSYLRIYPEKWFDKKNIWGWLTAITVLLSWCSVIVGAWVMNKYGKPIFYFFVSDSNKPMALITAICAFMFFKNLNIGYSKFINTVAASSFGVLLIHANSDEMRRWLWRDVLDNVGYYHTDKVVLHAIISVLAIYVICTVIDIARIKFIEKPMFDYFEKRSKE